jgi:hypothetical protein
MLSGDQCFAYAFFGNEASAAHAVQQLIEADFATERIGAAMLDDSGVHDVPMQHKTAIPKGMAIGLLLGATAGAFVLPGLNLITVGGAFAVLEAATVGGAAGSLAGAMGGMGLWKDEFNFSAAAFERGAVMVGVLTSEERSHAATAALSVAGAYGGGVATRAVAEARLRELCHAQTR